MAWLRARSAGDSFVLRTEDLDGPRTEESAVTGNLLELRWLGLDWDEGPDVGGPFSPYRQSERTDRYRRALNYLRDFGLTFDCWLSRKDLRELASAPHGALPAYGHVERRLNAQLQESKKATGKQPSIRLKAAEAAAGRVTGFDDLIAGRRHLDVENAVGDIVLLRADGMWAYQLAVVVDDIAMGIREVVRGADLLPSTAAQLVLYHAFEAPSPAFLHVPLLLDQNGERMAKRQGSLTLAALREMHTDPRRVTGLLAYSLGLLSRPEPLTPRELLLQLGPDWLDRLQRQDFLLSVQQLNWITGN